MTAEGQEDMENPTGKLTRNVKERQEARDETISRLRDTHVLVVGAGGLGCEVLKCLCLSGFRRIDVIDMDTIHVTNLHRQFLFRDKHVGRPKAQVAAEALNAQYAHLNVHVTGHVGRLEEKNEDFYRQFHIIVSGLDSIEARRWLNAMVHSLAETGEDGEVDLSSCIPLLDGGSEGLKGQARCIFPFVTSCFECSLQSFPPQTTYPLCTLAETPRLPEHCIEYAMLVLWTQQFPGREFDADDTEHLQWVYERAKQRAETFKIPGVTYRLALGVTKRIIPAVASTNAIIAAMLVEEALKIATFCVCSSHDARVAGLDSPSPTPSGPSTSSPSSSCEQSSEERKKFDSLLHEDRLLAESQPSSCPSSSLCGGDPESGVPGEREESASTQTQEGLKSMRELESPRVASALHDEDAPGDAPDDGGGGRRREATNGTPGAEELSGVQNYIMYMGETGIYTHTFEYAKKPAVLFLQKPPQLRRQLEANLPKTLRELAEADLLKEGEELLVTDAALPSTLRLRLFFESKVPA
ncbi:putative ubiquitin-activating enzyme [Neospora caninum Liverpool]|uniref:NEDD8-activating enzyme E1 catalytic subunit n=1 Tax=Neospora caninum (strain Liverpool) TaxID=572307 RepID=F0VBH3_NEOCL|nr:putative ubiquitin-activating enzyme [Neospora caninum Liverpool]CBZ50957.1 putative ubiquitin-activating enzyme [Neospora caninum Liverpool]|eukprot:XP_003880990.1 putative ubiquitin-activating enzyme [Neospora caninum Liverpool]